MKDPALLTVRELVIHEPPKKDGTPGALSDSLTIMTDKVQAFFEQRIKSALTSGIGIQFQEETESVDVETLISLDLGGASPPKEDELQEDDEMPASPVPNSIMKLLSEPNAPLIVPSRLIGRRLFQLHKRNQSDGLLCVLRCDLGGDSAIALIKLDHEMGVRAQRQEKDGHVHFTIQVIDDLMLTKNTRVFKVALFTGGSSPSFQSVEGLASDNQIERSNLLAGYFLKQFLGCDLAAAPDVTTKKFLDAAEAFINKEVSSPVDQARYHTAVIAELNSISKSVSPRVFADKNLKPPHREPFKAAMRAAGVPGTFSKRIDLVESRLAAVRIDFGNGVHVSSPPSEINKSVKVSKGEGDNTRVEVEAPLSKMRGAR